jgi:hypothetical protein
MDFTNVTETLKPVTLSPAFLMALAELRKKTEAPGMDGWNPHFKSKFAPIGEVLRVSREAMGVDWVLDICPKEMDMPVDYSFKDKEGASTQSTIWVMEARLIWCSTGEFISVRLPFAVNGDQTKQGATMSYNMRRAIMMLFVMEPEGDDDGASTMSQSSKRPTPLPEGVVETTKTDGKLTAADFWAKRKQTGFDFSKAKAIAAGPGTWEEKIVKLEAK